MNMKKIRILTLAVLLCFAMALAACDGQGASGSNNSTDAAYQVTVVDAAGNPYTKGVIVRFLQDGQQAAMQVVGENGVAEKVMAKGDYTVELMFTDAGAAYYYDQSDLTLSADKTQLQIVLTYATGENAQTLHAQGTEHEAYPVTVGSTHVKLTAGERSYFLFTPTEAGTYKVSMAEEGTQVGYYGAPHYVQESSAAEVVDNAFTVSVRAGMIGSGNTGTTVLVIGVDSESATEGTLTITRTGDPEYSVEDEPWTVYQATAALTEYKLPAGAALKEFDLTAAEPYTLVLNETDGFYHLDSADGPLVLVRLGEKSGGSKYLDSFETIVNHSGVVKYFFDAEGNFEKKESYTECLLAYIGYTDQGTNEKHPGCMDPDSGLYPLTEDLKYIIQQRGDYVGWWDPQEDLYLFADLPGINQENAWLFMCCYIGS